MSKKRKTREQKIAASQRQAKISLSATAHDSPLYSIAVNNPKPLPRQIQTTPVIQYADYSYVAHDAKKTLFVVASLVALNVVVYVLLQSNILHIKF